MPLNVDLNLKGWELFFEMPWLGYTLKFAHEDGSTVVVSCNTIHQYHLLRNLCPPSEQYFYAPSKGGDTIEDKAQADEAFMVFYKSQIVKEHKAEKEEPSSNAP